MEDGNGPGKVEVEVEVEGEGEGEGTEVDTRQSTVHSRKHTLNWRLVTAQ